VARPSPKPKTQPLITRPGARFRCSLSGVCCGDIHGLGLVTQAEVRELRKRDKLAVVYNEELEGFCMRPFEGRCMFVLPDQKCGIHAQSGHMAKPAGCRRFPYGLIRTPYGGRITTEHRCACRTLGDRPPVSTVDAADSLRDQGGRLEADSDAPKTVQLGQGKRVSFEKYLVVEAAIIERLNAGERAEHVLSARALPTLEASSWAAVAAEHIALSDHTSGSYAYAWFGDALLHLSDGHNPPKRPRPWAEGFLRALNAGSEEADPEAIYNDWIADEIWMFRWLGWGPFDVARSELVTRLAVARQVQAWMEKQGVHPGQAAAEAVMMCELAAEGSEWPSAVATIVRDPSPADPLPVSLKSDVRDLLGAVQPAPELDAPSSVRGAGYKRLKRSAADPVA
jgi:hypothetical protein